LILDANGWLADYGTNYLQAPLDFVNDIDSQLLFARSIITVLVLFAAAAISGYVAENHLTIVGELLEVTGRLERIRINTSDVLTHMESGLLTIDREGKIIFLNRAATEILQIEGTENEGRNYTSVFAGRLEPIRDFMRQILEGSSDLNTRNELKLQTREGSYMPLGLSPALLTDGDTIRGLIVVFQDLTQAKVTENRIRRQDRLAAIGELAAGIAHELRNPLASISGSAEVLQSGLDVEGEDRQLLDLIVNESVRINDIVEQFLNYARIQEMDRQRINLQELVNEVITLVKNHPSYTDGKEIITELENCPPVLVDAAQMKQVFLNLLLNGLEAVDGKGKICVCTSAEGEKHIAGKGQIEIWVQDDGPGVLEEHIESIFEPFHTDKRGGTGLGLAVVYKIMESNNGRILYAPPSDGKSTFRILLPRAEEVI